MNTGVELSGPYLSSWTINIQKNIPCVTNAVKMQHSCQNCCQKNILQPALLCDIVVRPDQKTSLFLFLLYQLFLSVRFKVCYILVFRTSACVQNRNSISLCAWLQLFACRILDGTQNILLFRVLFSACFCCLLSVISFVVFLPITSVLLMYGTCFLVLIVLQQSCLIPQQLPLLLHGGDHVQTLLSYFCPVVRLSYVPFITFPFISYLQEIFFTLYPLGPLRNVIDKPVA